MKKIINTERAPAAIGPYSQAVEGGGLIFLSGQLPLDLEGAIVGEDVKTQTRQALTNAQAIVEAAGRKLDDVLKTTVFLSDIVDFQDMNEVYAEFFKKECPARSAFQVAALPRGAKVEIEMVVSAN